MAEPEIYNDAQPGAPRLPGVRVPGVRVPSIREPAWGYQDLALFAGAILPAVALATILMYVAGLAVPRAMASNAGRQLTLQSFLYLELLGALYLLVKGRHQKPFWKALAWTFPVPRAWLFLLMGPILAVALSAAGVVLRTPAENSLIEGLITNRASLALFIVFGVVFAPLFEEMLFRGFLLPLFARSLGPWAGIAATAALFGLLHGAQNRWAWQQILLIGLAGAAFGYARLRTGSTTAGFLMHAAYNATAFAGYTLSHWRVLN